MLVSENTLWTASAGDSAAVGLSCDDDENTKSISTIHTVQGDRLRVQQLGTLRPDLLGGVFTPRMYVYCDTYNLFSFFLSFSLSLSLSLSYTHTYTQVRNATRREKIQRKVVTR